MSRRHAAVKRIIKADSKYNSVLLSKFINNIMREGKKALAESIVYKSLDMVEKKYNTEPFGAFMDAMNNVKPDVEVTSVRVGGANYQVPSQVSERRGYALAARWIIGAASKRSGRGMIEKLAGEISDAANNRGVAIKKKNDTHSMAESNKAFAHFAQRSSGGNR